MNKITTLRNQRLVHPVISPVSRLKTWLNTWPSPLPEFRLRPISEQKLLILLKKLKPSKALPSDLIDGLSLKTVAPVLLPSLLHLVNLSLTTSTFADIWKIQVTLPHHKKGEKDDLGNYRPVSNLVEVSKLTEMEAHDQLMNHFIVNDLFHPNHHGSLPGHDTTTALLQAQAFQLAAAEKKANHWEPIY